MAAEKTVKATAPGYHIGPRAIGDTFLVPVGLRGSWFKEVAPAQAAAASTGDKATVGNKADDELA